ncbi:hypothetical protein AQUCO_00900007v1 [Aquilegia coerulea]|uniref:Uncharacterized protein n=1 Tax=Aquilegia coerulea TaxID=218851 RepID=A0A2G5EBD8_AQUCA|nr:hypothetical protein AQUCO_00900007v1 [Aquilegia coerulea]
MTANERIRALCFPWCFFGRFVTRVCQRCRLASSTLDEIIFIHHLLLLSQLSMSKSTTTTTQKLSPPPKISKSSTSP